MADGTGPELQVEFSNMHQLAEARCQDDDWTGLKDRAARRKRQTRLNVRAHRKRKIQANSVSKPQCQSQHFQDCQTMPVLGQTYGALELRGTDCQTGTRSSSASGVRPVLNTFKPLSTNGSIILPLSSDHLIPLVQYNVFRATRTLMAILDLTHVIPIKCEGSYPALPGPLFPAPEVPPPSLAPTPLQLSVPHDMWIDMLPHGTMRDNAIRTMGTFDVDELCCDLVGGHYKGRNDLDLKGILVWSDPWCVSGWEVTEGFLKNWGFLLKGCWEILAATNRWRGNRGDEPLVFEL